jgi:hypothetical protein
MSTPHFGHAGVDESIETAGCATGACETSTRSPGSGRVARETHSFSRAPSINSILHWAANACASDVNVPELTTNPLRIDRAVITP